jgi:hypothetical protein
VPAPDIEDEEINQSRCQEHEHHSKNGVAMWIKRGSLKITDDISNLLGAERMKEPCQNKTERYQAAESRINQLNQGRRFRAVEIGASRLQLQFHASAYRVGVKQQSTNDRINAGQDRQRQPPSAFWRAE